MRLRSALFLTVALVAATPAAAQRGPLYAGAAAPMNQTVEQRLLPQTAVLLHKLLAEKRDMTLDGVKVFEADDTFLPGKIAIGLAYLIVDAPRSDPKFAEYLAAYRQIADMTVDDTNDTWGIYYYCQALLMLREAGLPATPEVRQWLRRFVDLMLPRLNLRGEGFEYRRSIGTMARRPFWRC